MKRFEITVQAHRTMIVDVQDEDVGSKTTHEKVAKEMAKEAAYDIFYYDGYDNGHGWDVNAIDCAEIYEGENQ